MDRAGGRPYAWVAVFRLRAHWAAALSPLAIACAWGEPAPADGDAGPAHDGGASPPAPVVYGTTGGTCVADVTLRWALVDGASYDVEWGRTNVATKTPVSAAVGASSLTLPSVRAGTYAWRVRANVGGVVSAWSQDVTFTVAGGNAGSFAQTAPADFTPDVLSTTSIVEAGVSLAGELDTGIGKEGTFHATAGATLPSGSHDFSSFRIDPGVSVVVTGSAPLVLRVRQGVSIDGTLDLRGADGTSGGAQLGQAGAGGAGGAAGGSGAFGAQDGSDGLGLGHGAKGTGAQGGSGAGYAGPGFPSPASMYGAGISGGPAYGSADLTMLLGGSGGGGGSGASGCGSGGGGGGGGVVQIAASQTIAIGPAGAILAGGGAGGSDAGKGCGGGGGGSGGAVWLAAPTIDNEGLVSAQGGAAGASATSAGGAGSIGRVRVDGTSVGSGAFKPAPGWTAVVGYDLSGSVTSPPIAPSGLCGWQTLDFDADTVPSGVSMTVDVLDANGALLVADVVTGTDLSQLDAISAAPAIKLRANLTTTSPATTPILKRWSVSYTSL